MRAEAVLETPASALTETTMERRMATQSLCKVDGCGKPCLARGWCSTHYQRWLKHGHHNGLAKIEAVLLCATCGEETSQTGYNQKHCPSCRKAIANRASRDWKRKDRAVEPARRVEVVACAMCRNPIPKTSSSRKFCGPCRETNDLARSRERTRKFRQSNPECHAESVRRAYDRRMAQPRYRIASRMSARVYGALRESKAGRSW
mgnify:CR=1 FL=1